LPLTNPKSTIIAMGAPNTITEGGPMALKRLTAQEMVQLSAPWISAKDPARAALEKVPLLAALLPQIPKAHDDGSRVVSTRSRHTARRSRVV